MAKQRTGSAVWCRRSRILPGEAQVGEALALEPGQGKPVPLHGEEGQEHGPEGVPGDGVPEEDHQRREVVEVALVAQGLEDAEGDADRVGQEEGDPPEVDGDGQAADDEVLHRHGVAEGVAQVEGGQVRQVETVAHQHGAVEAVVPLQALQVRLGDLDGGEAAAGRGPGLAGLVGAGDAHPHLVDGTARHELAQEEDDEGDAQQGGHDQEQAPEDVPAQGVGARDGHGRDATGRGRWPFRTPPRSPRCGPSGHRCARARATRRHCRGARRRAARAGEERDRTPPGRDR